MKVNNLFNLEDKVAVVTGGTGYLGMHICEALSEAGALVYITGKTKKRCIESAKSLERKTGIRVKGIEMNVSSSLSIKNCFKQIVKEVKKIDILVNNAFYSHGSSLHRISEKDWMSGIDGTINGVFRCTKAIIPIMEKNKFGSIINISSMYGMVSPDPSIYGSSGHNNPPNYGAGKAAIIQFTRYTACHLAKKGIRVNSVSPGPFPKPDVTDMRFISNLKKKTPMGRLGQPHEIKGVIVFLASQSSSFVTGTNISVDGGWTAW